MAAVSFRTPYDGSTLVVDLYCDSPSLTKQSFAAECDVNNIMRRYVDTGVLEHVRESPVVYSDVADAASFQDAMNTVAGAESLFAQLPAATRAAFGNDCVTFLDAFSDPAGQELLVECGVLVRDSVEAPAEERSATEPASAGGSPELAATPQEDAT